MEARMGNFVGKASKASKEDSLKWDFYRRRQLNALWVLSTQSFLRHKVADIGTSG